MSFKYLLDTNIVSYLIKGQHPHLNAPMAQAIAKQQAALSVISIAELRYGQALMHANDKRHPIIDGVIEQIPNLVWTFQAAELSGVLKAKLRLQGRPIGELDTQIAAHALAEDLILVTHNMKHFEGIEGLRLEDWTQ